MLRKIISGVLAIMVVVSTMLCTGCSGSTDVDIGGEEINISQVYQYNATCSGPELDPKATNKITLTKATSSSPAVSFYDFKVKLGYTTYNVSATSSGIKKTTWEGMPKEGATTVISNVSYITSVGGRVNLSTPVNVEWTKLEVPKNGIRDGEATVKF